MDISAVTAASIWAEYENKELYMEQFPVVGLVKTHSLDYIVTDSAAAATALASGVKTQNKSIGGYLDKNKQWQTVKSLSHYAKKKGLSVGIISTARTTHATPAAFYANVLSRDHEIEIAAQFVESADIDLLMGGGRKSFFSKDWRDPEDNKPGLREDGRNLVSELKAKGWSYVQSQKELQQLEPAREKSPVLALFSYDHMNYELHRSKDVLGEPSLTEMVKFAISYLSQNPKGYFLMVEGGRIDHAGHANIAEHYIAETLSLDKAVGAAFEQTQKSGDTLLVVTSDHGTGGMQINGYPAREGFESKDILGNAKKSPKKGEKNWSIITWASGPGGDSSTRVPATAKEHLHRATIRTDAALHTGIHVPLFSSGPGANNFSGTLDNTEVPKRIKKLLGLGVEPQ